MNVFKFNKNKTTIALVALGLAFLASSLIISCAEEFESPSTVTGSTLVDLAATDTTLQIFTAAIAKTGLGISLDNVNSGQHTVFAPTDSAFRVYLKANAPAPPSSYDTDAGAISYINSMSPTSFITLAAFTSRLQYHVISSEVLASEVTTSQVFTTINGARMSLSKNGSNVFINANRGVTGGKVRKLDIDGANGVLHTIDKVLVPLGTANSGSPGGLVTNALGSTVDYTKSPPTITIAGTQNTNYDILAGALKKTGLTFILRPNVATASLPEYTVFAPDDAAMDTYLEELSASTFALDIDAINYINSLTGAGLTAFTDVMKYHIVTGRVLTTDLSVNQVLTTMLAGKTFTVSAINLSASPYANFTGVGSNSTITSPDLVTNSGALQRLSVVLKPQ